jgi:hypothetical protein
LRNHDKCPLSHAKARIDQRLNACLPFKVVHPFHPDIPIALRQLATHISGITDRVAVYHDAYHWGGGAPESLGDFLQGYFCAEGRDYTKGNFLPVKLVRTATIPTSPQGWPDTSSSHSTADRSDPAMVHASRCSRRPAPSMAKSGSTRLRREVSPGRQEPAPMLCGSCRRRMRFVARRRPGLPLSWNCWPWPTLTAWTNRRSGALAAGQRRGLPDPSVIKASRQGPSIEVLP